jgi:hypothetical protein
MPESEIRKELEALNIRMQAVMQLRSMRRDEDPENDRPLTPHFIVSVARGPVVAKVRSLTDLCGLRVKLKCCSCGGNYTANYRDCSKWKEVKAAAAMRAQEERCRKDEVSTRRPAPKSVPPKPSPEKEKLGPGWNHVVRGGSVVKAQATPNHAPTSSGTGRRTARQAAATGGQRKPASTDLSVVESQPPRCKQTDCTPSPAQSLKQFFY